MTEDERQNLLETVAEAQGGLSEVAFKLRRELTPKAPALKAAIKAEREIFRLKHELQRFDIEDLEQAKSASRCPRSAGAGRRWMWTSYCGKKLATTSSERKGWYLERSEGKQEPSSASTRSTKGPGIVKLTGFRGNKPPYRVFRRGFTTDILGCFSL